MSKSKKHFFAVFVQLLLVVFMVISSGITSFVRVNAEEDEVGLDYSFVLKLDGNEIKQDDKPVLKNGSSLDGEIHFTLSNLKSGTGEDAIKEIPLSVSGMDIQTKGGGDIYDDNNEYAGTYTFEDGKIIITIDGDYRNTHSDIEGKLNFNGKLSLNSADLKNGDETQISIGDQSWNITYSDGKKSGTGSVYKNTIGSVYKEGDSYYQDYEISLDCTNVWESNGITFKQGTYVDDLGANLQLDGTIKVMNPDGTYSEYGSFDEIPDITLNSSFSQTKFKYRVKLLNVDTLSDVFHIENDDSYKNGFAANYNDGENDNKVENKDKVSVNVVKPSVNKSGKLSDDQTSLIWTITINVGSYKGSFTNLNEIVSNISDTSASGGFTVPALSVDDFIENPVGSGNYTYTYETPITNLDSTKLGYEYDNTVDVTLDGQDYKATANVKKNTDPNLNLLDKQLKAVDYENKKFTWIVDVTFYDGMKSVSLKDKVGGGGHHDSQEIYWNDVKLVGKGSDGGSVVTEEGKNILDEGKEYYTEYYEHTLYFSDAFVNAHIGEPLHFTYVTTVDKFENLNEYTNTATLLYSYNGKDYSSGKSASYIHKVRTTKTGEVDSQENKINYTVDFDLKGLENLEEGKVVELEDHLNTDKFKIDPDSVKYYFNVKQNEWYEYNENSVVVQGTFDEDHSVFKIQVTQQMIDFINMHPTVFATRIRVTYSVIPEDLKEFYKDSKEQTQVIKNTVTSRYAGNEIEKTTSTEEIQPKSLVSKTGWIKNGDIVNSYATFEVIVNPNGIQLNGGKSLKATDKMNLNLSYLDNSLKIFNTKDNTELSKDKYSCQWDEGTNSLQFELPDETPMKITYKAILNVPTGTTLDESNSKNTFTLFNTDNAASNQSAAFLTGLFIPSASISGETAELDIFKYTKVEGSDIPLANAKFSIYEYGKTEPVSFQDKTVFTTKENGYAIVRLLKDKIYELKEVEAPKGYSKDTTSKYFVFKGNDFNKLTLPENTTVFDENNKVNTIVGTINVENQLQKDEKGQLVIEKISEGAATPDSTKFIITGPNNYHAEVTYKDFNDGKWIAKELPLGDYTITEDITSATVDKKSLNVKVDENGTYVAGNVVSVKIENGKSSVAKFKNTYTNVKTAFTVKKNWNDDNNAKGKRTTSIEIQLRNGNQIVRSVILNQDNNWTHTWNDLDKYDSEGHEITYSVTETPVNGYITSVNGGEITNTVTRVNVSKVDATDMHVLTGAHLQILEGTNVVDEWDSTDSVHEIAGLKVETEYKLHETTAPAGYKLASDITFKINKNGKVESAGNVDRNGTLLIKDEQISKTSYTVEKQWADNDNAKGRRPEAVVVHLLRDGAVYGDPVTLNEANHWKHTWSDLDVTDANNQPYVYSVSEETVNHYNGSSSANGNNIVLTNTYVDTSKTVKIVKTDVDGNLLGGAVLSVKDTAGNIVASWTTVQGEEKDLSLEPGSYELHEESAPAGYELASDIAFEVTEDGSVKVNGAVVDRVSMQDMKTKTSFTVKKNWNDDNNAKGKRPDSIKVNLNNDNQVVHSVILNQDNNWTYTWNDLDKFDSEGHEIAYFVTETPVDGYTTSINNGDITNTLDEGKLQLTKIITGLPDTVDKKDLAFVITGPDNYQTTIQLKDMDFDETTGLYSKTLTGLTPGDYTVTENSADFTGYSRVTTVNGNEADNGTVTVRKDAVSNVDITNTYTENPGKLVITKTISGNVTEEALNNVKFVITDSERNTTEFTLASMKQPDGSYMKEISDLKPGVYTVREENAEVSGYELTTTYTVNNGETNEVSVVADAESAIEIHNDYRHIEGNLEFTKTFTGSVPEGVTDVIQFKVIKEDGQVVGTYPLASMDVDENGVYHQIITGLAPGKYIVTEENAGADGYSLTTTYKVGDTDTQEVEVIDQQTAELDITNTYTEKPGKLVITKTVDGDVTEEALNNVKFVVTDPEGNTTDFTLASMKQTDGSYKKELTDLKPGTYTVSEESAEVDHYSRTTTYKVGENEIDGSVDVPRDGEVTVDVTNTYTFVPDKTSYTVTKVWDDNDNEKQRRPESIVVYLLRDGAVYGDSVTLSAENNWTYTWSDLDAEDENHTYSYTAGEDFVEYYSGTFEFVENGTNLINHYIDTSKTVKIAKSDEGGNLLGGAVLSVEDVAGNIVASWATVQGEEKELSLEPGSYVLHEESAPAGYDVAGDIAFEVTDDGIVKVNDQVVDRVSMVDKDSSFDVTISKVDAGSGKALSGAKLQLKNSSGKVIEEWTSKDKKVVSLTKGVYTLHEVEAPENYKLAEDIVFEVNQYGEVSVNGKRVDVVAMKDVPKAKVVDTSDHSHVSWNSLIGAVSLVAAGMMLYLRKRVN